MPVEYKLAKGESNNKPRNIYSKFNPTVPFDQKLYMFIQMTNFDGDFPVTFTFKFANGKTARFTINVPPASWLSYDAWASPSTPMPSGQASVTIESSTFGGFEMPFKVADRPQLLNPEETGRFWENRGFSFPEAQAIALWVQRNNQSPSDAQINQLLIDVGLREDPDKKTFLEKLLEAAGNALASLFGFKPSLVEKTFLEVTGLEFTEQQFLDLRIDQIAFLTPLDELSRLFFSKNLKGEDEEFKLTEDSISLIADALFFLKPAKVGIVGVKLFTKTGGKGLLGVTGKAVTKKASPEIINALVKSGNYKNLMQAIRTAPGEWAKIAPRLSTESKNLILAGLRKQADPTAFNLMIKEIAKVEGTKGLSFFHRILPIKEHPFKTAAAVIVGMNSLLGIDIWGNWAIIDNLAFTLNREAQAARDLFINGKLTKEEALAELDRLISLSEAGQKKVESSAKLNPIQFLFLPLWDDVARENTDLLRTVKANIESVEAPLPIGILILNPTPSDAKVSIEGQIPTTGVFNKELSIGIYSWTVSKFGFVSDSSTVTIKEGETTEIDVEIFEGVEPEGPPPIPPGEIKGKLIISSIPSDAIITVAGHEEIQTPGTYKITTGPKGVRAEKEGFLSQTKNVFVRSDIDTEVSFILLEIEPSEPPPIPLPKEATITFTSNPSNADVYINGEYTFTKTPYTTLLEAGNYIFRVQKSGFFPVEIIGEVLEGETDTLNFDLEEIPAEQLPSDPFIPFIPKITPGFESLFPSPVSFVPFETKPKDEEKEILVNIETTDAKPWKGRIYSIAFQDLSVPDSIPTVLINENESELLNEFINFFNQSDFTKLVGFKTTFDHRFIFNKLMLYRMQSKKWARIELKDVKQLMDQVKEEFVYFPDKTGTLDDYGKELLGKGKYGPQKTMLKMFLAKNFPYVQAFQMRQIEITKQLYDLFNFSSSESFISPISSNPGEGSSHETPVNSPSFEIGKEKQCKNCLQINPMNNSECLVCGDPI